MGFLSLLGNSLHHPLVEPYPLPSVFTLRWGWYDVAEEPGPWTAQDESEIQPGTDANTGWSMQQQDIFLPDHEEL